MSCSRQTDCWIFWCRPRPGRSQIFEAKAKAKALRRRSRPRPKFWPRGLDISAEQWSSHTRKAVIKPKATFCTRLYCAVHVACLIHMVKNLNISWRIFPNNYTFGRGSCLLPPCVYNVQLIKHTITILNYIQHNYGGIQQQALPRNQPWPPHGITQKFLHSSPMHEML